MKRQQSATFAKIFKHKYTNDTGKLKVNHYTGKLKGVAHSVQGLKYSIPKEIPAVFHNELNYDYHLIIKELAKEFEWEFNCLGENTETYETFPVSITKEFKRIDKNGKEIIKIPLFLCSKWYSIASWCI